MNDLVSTYSPNLSNRKVTEQTEHTKMLNTINFLNEMVQKGHKNRFSVLMDLLFYL